MISPRARVTGVPTVPGPGRTRGRWLAVAFAVAITVGLGACSPSPSPPQTIDLSTYYQQKLDWKPCRSGGMQCAWLAVPLRYSDPGAKAIKLALLRVPASAEQKRIGSLVINPGGPGASGVDFAAAAEYVFPPSVRAVYDVVGFDPRGVGESSPIRCLTDQQTDDFLALDLSPDDPAEVARTTVMSQEFGQRCEQNSPALTPVVGTVDVARDLDILRATLGEQKLNFMGKSYGTFIGSTYAGMFADKVGRFVLDGAIDPTLTNADFARGQAAGFQNALRRFAADCPKHDDCPLPGGVDAAIAKIDTMLVAADRTPLKTGTPRTLTQALAVLGIAGSLYSPDPGWSQLRFALAEAFRGNGSVLLELADLFTERNEDGTFESNMTDALYAVNCLDRPDRADAAATAVLADELAEPAPTFGAFMAWGNLPCSTWPAPATDAPHQIDAAGAAPIVVVGTTYDPATPYPWAVGLAEQLDSGVLISYRGDGHTAYYLGSRCVDQAVNEYLLAGTVPPEGLFC